MIDSSFISWVVINPLTALAWLALVPVAAYLHLLTLWLFYLAGMNLEKVKKTEGLTKEVTFLSAPLQLLAPLINLSFTVVWGTLLFLDLPQEGAFSLRLQRYCLDDAYAGTWRRKVALYLSQRLLNPHDFWGGAHVKGS